MTKTLTFWDVFSDEILNDIYDRFEDHLNQPVISSPFYKEIEEEVMKGLLLENTLKILSNHKVPTPTQTQLSEVIEFHCYGIWFPMKSLEGHIFTKKEKVALASWSVKQVEPSLKDTKLEDVMAETFATVSSEVLEATFQFCLSQTVLAYQEVSNVPSK